MSKLKRNLSVIGVIVGLLVLAGVVVPAMIRGFFYILLQMMYYPLTTMIILVNLMLFQYLWIKYTEKKLK